MYSSQSFSLFRVVNRFLVIAKLALFTLVFHTQIYFEHRVFLVLDNAFFCYNKGTRRNQNKVINERNSVFRFTRSSVLQVNNIIRLKKYSQLFKNQITANGKMSRHADAWPRQPEKFWNLLGILITTYLAPELICKSVFSTNTC